MPSHPLALGSAARRHDGVAIGRRLAHLGSLLLLWQERSRQRRQLRDLDPRLWRDLGLTEADLQRECAKPFWRP